MATARIAATPAAIEQWLNQAVNYERSGDFHAIQLDRIRSFLKHLPSPPAPCTIAGTKGKGSTTRLMECATLAAGLPTLTFTSPHLATVLERWRRNGVPAEALEVAEACTQVAQLEERHRVRLTYFERTFAVACLLASAIEGTRFFCEVGLGGRLDCANALDCAVAVVTHLSHDHRDVLGPTLHHIAREKLAIARPARPLVIAPQTPAAALALWREIGRRPWLHQDQIADRLQQPSLHWVPHPARGWTLALLGAHQQDNAATAATALRLFLPDLREDALRAGFAQARLAARCQLVEYAGRHLLIDGAHNGPSVEATMQVARTSLGEGWRLILGTARDKEIAEILAVLPAHVQVIRCGYVSPRARNEADWPEAARAWPWFESVSLAIAAQPAGVDLCITGSLYLASEVLTCVGLAGALPG